MYSEQLLLQAAANGRCAENIVNHVCDPFSKVLILVLCSLRVVGLFNNILS